MVYSHRTGCRRWRHSYLFLPALRRKIGPLNARRSVRAQGYGERGISMAIFLLPRVNWSANAEPQLREAASPQVLRSGCLQRYTIQP